VLLGDREILRGALVAPLGEPVLHSPEETGGVLGVGGRQGLELRLTLPRPVLVEEREGSGEDLLRGHPIPLALEDEHLHLHGPLDLLLAVGGSDEPELGSGGGHKTSCVSE